MMRMRKHVNRLNGGNGIFFTEQVDIPCLRCCVTAYVYNPRSADLK